jgi:Protein of unknown function (DUF2827)
MKKLCVGVSIFSTASAHIWSSGINQNIAFLLMLLRQLPTVGQIYLLNGGDADQLPSSLEFNSLEIPLVKPEAVSFELDVVIEMGAKLPLQWMRHMRALGVKLVCFQVGHIYSQIMETAIFERSENSPLNDAVLHEVWCLPKDALCNHALLRTVTRAPVLTMPHLWSPLFLLRQMEELARRGISFGFDTRQRARMSKTNRQETTPTGWRVAIFEPNISVVKSYCIPMLVCEQAYRVEPDAIHLMMAMNTFHMKAHPTFHRFAAHLDLTRDGKASYEPRVAFAPCMAEHGLDAVVSHQSGNPQNYLYYDALYGGYPLIHNSPLLQAHGQGFYYPDFDAHQGARQLLQAWRCDHDFWHDYARRARAYLERLSPIDAHNARAFMARLHRADASAPERMA